MYLRNMQCKYQETDKAKESSFIRKTTQMVPSSPMLETTCLTSWDRKGMTWAQIAFSLLTISACKREKKKRKKKGKESNKENSQLVINSQNISRMILKHTLYSGRSISKGRGKLSSACPLEGGSDNSATLIPQFINQHSSKKVNLQAAEQHKKEFHFHDWKSVFKSV